MILSPDPWSNRPTASSAGPGVTGGGAFTLADLEYDLPPELIAQSPAAERDQARLLVVGLGPSPLTDARVSDLPGFLRSGDLLVLNDTRVVPARITLRRATGGRIEGLFLSDRGGGLWEVMLKGASRCRPGEALNLLDRSGRVVRQFTLQERMPEGRWTVALAPLESDATGPFTDQARRADDDTVALLNDIGSAPLPPYIRRAGDAHAARNSDDAAESPPSPDKLMADDLTRYQTVYARAPGAVAAPTAGLHFTPRLLAQLADSGIPHAFVTLHVGWGTFKPITADRINDHVMHEERFDLPRATVDAVQQCRARGGRVVAVGTTTVRVLESCVDPSGAPRASQGSTRLFIYPPYRFRVVDLMLTNFHLPGSTLLALVMAFGGVTRIREAYEHAIRSAYRFYSYGDATLVSPEEAPTRTPWA